MAELVHGPTSHVYFSQRLRLHYVDWGNDEAEPILLVHGGRDHCRNWDWLARELREDYHIVAPDLRGHGDSEWSIGGTYGTLEFVYDIAQLVDQKHLKPVTIIAHSMGGGVSLAYAGIYPEAIKKMIVIEGMGPSRAMAARFGNQKPHDRLQSWITSLRKMSARVPRRYPTLEDAFQRMYQENKHLTEEQARHLTVHGSNQNEDGTYSWKFDNYVRTTSPAGLDIEDIEQLWQRITCPVLLIQGSESWAAMGGDDDRLKFFSEAESVTIQDAGHWVHHDQLDEVLKISRAFLRK